MAQVGYITPTARGVPSIFQPGENSEVAHKCDGWLHNTGHFGGPNASKRRPKSQVAHKWARWLHNTCCLGGIQHFTTGHKVTGGPQVGTVAAQHGSPEAAQRFKAEDKITGGPQVG